MVEKILNNTTPYGKIRASHEGSLHSSTLRQGCRVYIEVITKTEFNTLPSVHRMKHFNVSLVMFRAFYTKSCRSCSNQN